MAHCMPFVAVYTLQHLSLISAVSSIFFKVGFWQLTIIKWSPEALGFHCTYVQDLFLITGHVVFLRSFQAVGHIAE